jgi:hypothetical protein
MIAIISKRHWRRDSVSPESWKLTFEIIALVAVGISVAAGAAALVLGNRINKAQAVQLGQFNVDVTAAKTELGRQQVRAAKAEQDAAEAKTTAAKANDRTQVLEADTAKQQERAAIAEKALMELQERLAHRRIDPSQHAKLVAVLQPFAGSVVALTKLGDSEAGTFADSIISVLTDARWHVNLTMVGTMSPPIYGLQCSINEQSQAAKTLAVAMRGLPTAVIISDPSLPIIANLIVGLKPPP